MKNTLKIKRDFAGWYTITEGKEIKYTIVQSGNGSWNVFESDDTARGWIDAADTYKEAKEIIGL